MKFQAIPHITTEKISKERVFQLVRVALYTLLFTAMIIHLNEYDNQLSETRKTTQGLIVLVFFMVFLLAMQRVKILNIPSLVVTLVFAPIAVLQAIPYTQAPVVFQNSVLESVVNLLALLLIADMVATKRVRKWNRANLYFFGLFALVTLLMVYQRPYAVAARGYLYFLLLFLVKTDDEEWGRVLGGILNAGVISFALVLILSFILNPQFIVKSSDGIMNVYEVAESEVNPSATGRWYGYFLNIGTFGQFVGLQTALAFVSIIRSKERYGRLSIMYFLSLVWMGGALFISVLVGTSDFLAGAILMLIIVLVFGFKKTEFPRLLIRSLVMVIVLLALGILLMEGVDWVLSPAFDPAVLQNIVDKTPLKYFPSGANYIIAKLTRFHELRQINGAFISSPMLLFFNYLGATRPAIWRVYMQYTTFHAGNSTGLPYQRFFFMGAHNQYVQELFSDGYFVGGLNIILFISGFIGSIVGYVKTKTEKYFAPMVLFPMMLGMWVGELSHMFFALTFITMVLFVPLMDKYKYTMPDYFTRNMLKKEAEEEEEAEEVEEEVAEEVVEKPKKKKGKKSKEDDSEEDVEQLKDSEDKTAKSTEKHNPEVKEEKAEEKTEEKNVEKNVEKNEEKPEEKTEEKTKEESEEKTEDQFENKE